MLPESGIPVLQHSPTGRLRLVLGLTIRIFKKKKFKLCKNQTYFLLEFKEFLHSPIIIALQ